jgi:GR25 family glycosyltransferase involved in LPS biosynthesis
MNNNFITYWINLDKSIDRKEYMIKLLKKYKIKNIRIPGIDGTNKSIVDRLVKYKNSDDNNSKNLNFFLNDKEIKYENHHVENFDKQLGCLISHINAIKYFYEKDNNDYCLILEDDVNFDLFAKYNLNFNETINSIVKECNKEWDILQLSYTVKKSGALSSNPIDMYLDWFPKCYGTVGYVINKKGAKKLINHIYINNKIIIDNNNFYKYVADFYLYSQLKTYIYKIPIFSFNSNFDSIINSSKDLESKASLTINEHRNYFKIYIENVLPKNKN